MMKRKTLHFKNKRSYMRWLAFDHSRVKHHHRNKNKPIIYIGRKRHRVKHTK